jgi:dihydroorotase
MSVLIRQAKVIDPQSEFHNKIVDVLIENGKVKDIANSLKAKADQVIEGEDLHISQGWVDVFADYREPGYEHKETIDNGLRVAAAGGFTDVFLAPNTNPGITNKSAVQFLLQKAKNNAVTIHPLGAITQDLEGKSLAEMLDMHAHGAIAFSDGWKPLQNANLMLKALEYAKSFDGVLMQIPLDASLSTGGLMHEGITSTRLGMAGVPVLAESIMIHRDLELLRYTGSRLHFTGVSTAAGVEMVRRAKAEGLDVTCSVTPYHLVLTDEALNTYDSVYKVSPVLRDESDREALVASLKDGTIDCISSHHRPQEWDAKAKEFEYASEGMNLQEISYSIINSLGLGTELLIEKLSTAPRRLFSLTDHPIKKDAVVNMTVFQPAATYRFNAGLSKSANNPFLGKDLTGKVKAIISGNRIQLA